MIEPGTYRFFAGPPAEIQKGNDDMRLCGTNPFTGI